MSVFFFFLNVSFIFFLSVFFFFFFLNVKFFSFVHILAELERGVWVGVGEWG